LKPAGISCADPQQKIEQSRIKALESRECALAVTEARRVSEASRFASSVHEANKFAMEGLKVDDSRYGGHAVGIHEE
jgi:hypothetical protein